MAKIFWIIIKCMVGLINLLDPKGKKARKEAYAKKADKKKDEIHDLDEEIKTLTAHHIAAMRSHNHGLRAKLEGLLAGAYAKRAKLRRKQKHLEGQTR